MSYNHFAAGAADLSIRQIGDRFTTSRGADSAELVPVGCGASSDGDGSSAHACDAAAQALAKMTLRQLDAAIRVASNAKSLLAFGLSEMRA